MGRMWSRLMPSMRAFAGVALSREVGFWFRAESAESAESAEDRGGRRDVPTTAKPYQQPAVLQ